MDDRLYIVVWINEHTEAQGSSKPMACDAARAWLRDVKGEHPDVKHEIVEYKG